MAEFLDAITAYKVLPSILRHIQIRGYWQDGRIIFIGETNRPDGETSYDVPRITKELPKEQVLAIEHQLTRRSYDIADNTPQHRLIRPLTTLGSDQGRI